MRKIALTVFALLMSASAALAQVSVTSEGAVCDQKTDDTAAFNKAIKVAESGLCGNYIQLPAGKQCLISSTLVLNTCIGFQGNGGAIYAPNVAGPIIQVNSFQPGYNYFGNAAPWTNIAVYGTTKAGSIGLQVNASNWTLDGLIVNNVVTGVQFGSYSYSDTIRNFEIYQTDTGVYYPNGLTDAGEEISFDGGSIFNNQIGLEQDGGEFHFTHTSFDFDTLPLNDNSGILTLDMDHVEGFNQAPIQSLGAVNAWNHTIVDKTVFLTDSNVDLPLILINGGYAQFTHTFLGGFSNTTGLVTGSASGNVSLCGTTDGQTFNDVPNVGVCP
jgi:hypothetical protein